jgi:hypothetical protein
MSIAPSLEASINLGHNYLGCEHLILGLLAGEGSEAASALRGSGVDNDRAHRPVTSAIAGFAHAREPWTIGDRRKFDDVIGSLDAVESRLNSVRA